VLDHVSAPSISASDTQVPGTICRRLFGESRQIRTSVFRVCEVIAVTV